MIAQTADELRIARRAANLYFWLGAADLLVLLSGETITLLLFMIGLYFWVFVAWVACAAYAAYLSLRRTRDTSLRVLSALALAHVGLGIAHPGVPLPWGGWFGGSLPSEAAQVFCRLSWIATAVAMVVLAYVVRRKGKKLALAGRATGSPEG